MKKTTLLVLFINTIMLQANSAWIWEEEKEQAKAELVKKNQAIEDAEAKLEAIQIKTTELEKRQIQILKEIEKTIPRKKPRQVLVPNRYTLNINTSPRNSRYTLRNSRNQKINYKWGMKLKKGNYTLSVWKSGYKSKTVPINLNRNRSIPVKLVKPKKICKLKINTNVSSPTIRFRNSTRRYTRGMTLTCNQSYFLNISKPGYIRKPISTFMRNSNTTITENLSANVIKPKYCNLTIQPNKRGVKVSITNILEKYKNRISLPCRRTYNIKVTKKGCTTRRFDTYLKNSEKILVDLKCR